MNKHTYDVLGALRKKDNIVTMVVSTEQLSGGGWVLDRMPDTTTMVGFVPPVTVRTGMVSRQGGALGERFKREDLYRTGGRESGP